MDPDVKARPYSMNGEWNGARDGVLRTVFTESKFVPVGMKRMGA